MADLMQERGDGDNFIDQEGNSNRSVSINTAESVSPIEQKNSAKGRADSQVAASLFPAGENYRVDKVGEDKFGRNLTNTFLVDDKDADVEVPTDLAMMHFNNDNYFVQFGFNGDPELDAAYKSYFSDHAPFQYGTIKEELDEENYNIMLEKDKTLRLAVDAMNRGTGKYPAVKAAILDLMKDKDKLAAFKNTQQGWDRVAPEKQDGTARTFWEIANSDPYMRDFYNRSARNSTNTLDIKGLPPLDFMDKMSTSFQMFGTWSAVNDVYEMNEARQFGKDLETGVDLQQLTSDLINPAHRTMIAEEYDKHGAYAAQIMKQQMVQDLANSEMFDNMHWGAQLLYGAGAFIVDPLTLIPGVAIGKAGAGAAKFTKMYALSREINAAVKGTPLWAEKIAGRTVSTAGKYASPGDLTVKGLRWNETTTIAERSTVGFLKGRGTDYTSSAWSSKGLARAGNVAKWTGMGAVEGVFSNLPRLAADHTYTGKDYMLDVAMDAAFGTAIPVVWNGVLKPTGHFLLGKGKVDAARTKNGKELQERVDKWHREDNGPKPRQDTDPDQSPIINPVPYQGGGQAVQSAETTSQNTAAEAQWQDGAPTITRDGDVVFSGQSTPTPPANKYVNKKWAEEKAKNNKFFKKWYNEQTSLEQEQWDVKQELAALWEIENAAAKEAFHIMRSPELKVGNVDTFITPDAHAKAVETRAAKLQRHKELVSQIRKSREDMAPLYEAKNEIEAGIKALQNRKSKYPPLAQIVSMGRQAWDSAFEAIRDKFPYTPKPTAMTYLLGSQNLLNKQVLTPAERDLVNQLNAEVLKLAYQFPDGKVPPSVLAQIDGIHWEQKEYHTRALVHEFMSGDLTTENTGMYLNHILKQEGLVPEGSAEIMPLYPEEFIDDHLYLLNKGHADSMLDRFEKLPDGTEKEFNTDKQLDELDPTEHDPDINQLATQNISIDQSGMQPETSFLLDFLEINRKIVEKQDDIDPDIVDTMAMINGVINRRIEQIIERNLADITPEMPTFEPVMPNYEAMDAKQMRAALDEFRLIDPETRLGRGKLVMAHNLKLAWERNKPEPEQAVIEEPFKVTDETTPQQHRLIKKLYSAPSNPDQLTAPLNVSKQWGRTVKNTATDIVRQLAERGIFRGTEKYRAGIKKWKELRDSGDNLKPEYKAALKQVETLTQLLGKDKAEYEALRGKTQTPEAKKLAEKIEKNEATIKKFNEVLARGVTTREGKNGKTITTPKPAILTTQYKELTEKLNTWRRQGEGKPSAAYTKAFKKLRSNKRINVSDEVNLVGRDNSYKSDTFVKGQERLSDGLFTKSEEIVEGQEGTVDRSESEAVRETRSSTLKDKIKPITTIYENMNRGVLPRSKSIKNTFSVYKRKEKRSPILVGYNEKSLEVMLKNFKSQLTNKFDEGSRATQKLDEAREVWMDEVAVGLQHDPKSTREQILADKSPADILDMERVALHLEAKQAESKVVNNQPARDAEAAESARQSGIRAEVHSKFATLINDAHTAWMDLVKEYNTLTKSLRSPEIQKKQDELLVAKEKVNKYTKQVTHKQNENRYSDPSRDLSPEDRKANAQGLFTALKDIERLNAELDTMYAKVDDTKANRVIAETAEAKELLDRLKAERESLAQSRINNPSYRTGRMIEADKFAANAHSWIVSNFTADEIKLLADDIHTFINGVDLDNPPNMLETIKTLKEKVAAKAEANKPPAGGDGGSTPPPPPTPPTPPPAPTPPPINEDSIETFIEGESITLEEHTAIGEQLEEVENILAVEKAEQGKERIKAFVDSGEQALMKFAMQVKGGLDYLGRTMSFLTRDSATAFMDSDLESLQYFGANITEIGRGFAGKIKRKATGSLWRNKAYTESIGKIAKPYVDAIEALALERGMGSIKIMRAQNRAGAANKLVKEFNLEVFKIQELKRQNKPLPEGTSPAIIKFIDDWDKYMTTNFDMLLDAGIAGFKAGRNVVSYIPHIWKSNSLSSAIKKHGEKKIHELFTKAYMGSSARVYTRVQAENAATSQIEFIKRQGGVDGNLDQYVPAIDSRAMNRKDLDTTMEHDGVSIMELMDTDVIGVANKYSNRMAGWVGLSKGTEGWLNSDLGIQALRKSIEVEGKTKGLSERKMRKYLQGYDDIIDQMFGRPTRTFTQGGIADKLASKLLTSDGDTVHKGLPNELRQLKDLAALTKMGGLGTAQFIETGQALTRNMLNLYSDPAMFRKTILMAGGDPDDKGLMREIQAISGISDDIEWFDRQSVHLDQHELDEVSNIRKTTLWMADKLTGGETKAEASRLLGKISGYNMTRRFQQRLTQASFVMDIAKHFRDGTGNMSNERMADLGLTDVDGFDADLSNVFNSYVEFDANGHVKKLNADQWPKAVREKFQLAMIRSEAQEVHRTHIGELPTWMNRPLMGLIMQFRQMPLTATNKSMARNLAFADMEGVMGVMMNAAFAGTVRAAKFGALGYSAAAIAGDDEPQFGELLGTDEEFYGDVSKYITQFGIFADFYDLVLGYTEENGDTWENVGRTALDQIPTLGVVEDYSKAAKLGYEGEIGQAAQAMEKVTPLSNTWAGTVISDTLHRMADELEYKLNE